MRKISLPHPAALRGISSLALLCLFPAAGAAAPSVSATHSSTPTPSTISHLPNSPAFNFLDGGRSVDAEYTGGTALRSTDTTDAVRSGLKEISMTYDTLMHTQTAYVDQHAIARFTTADGAPLGAALSHLAMANLGLRPVQGLMPSLGMWQVADARAGHDGLQLAARLAPHVGGDSGLTDAIPDLHFLRRRHQSDWPNDPMYASQWYFDRINMQGAWELERGSEDVTVVVIDGGCDMQHPDLIANLDGGRDVVDEDDDPTYDSEDPSGAHGTACAGIIAAESDNALGITGACPNCRLRCVRLLAAEDTPVPVSADVNAMQYAMNVGAAVVSNSWGFIDAVAVPQALADAINNLHDNGRNGTGALVVFAAGNDDHEIRYFELQSVRGVLGVGAINYLDERTAFTNYGEAVDLVAPLGTHTTDNQGDAGYTGGDYVSDFGGTSSACPVVAGVGALLASADPSLTASELTQLLIDTATPAPYANVNSVPHDPIYGHGIVNPVGALSRVLGLDQAGDDSLSDEDEGCSATSPTQAASWLLCCSLLLARRRHRFRSNHLRQ